MQTVQPTAWAAAGGQASIRSINDQLLINQTPLAHDEISRLLQDLRKAANEGSPLWRPVNASFQDAKLKDALEALVKQVKVDLYVNWQSLESAGIKPDTVVTVQAGRVPLGTALQLTLDNANRQTPRAGCRRRAGGAAGQDAGAGPSQCPAHDVRDLYAQAGKPDKVMEQLTQMLRENDVAYVSGIRSGAPATQRGGGGGH